jgi:hypothetical protein
MADIPVCTHTPDQVSVTVNISRENKIFDREMSEDNVSKYTKRAVWTQVPGNSLFHEYFAPEISIENPSGLKLIKRTVYLVGGVPIFTVCFAYDADGDIISENCVTGDNYEIYQA